MEAFHNCKHLLWVPASQTKGSWHRFVTTDLLTLLVLLPLFLIILQGQIGKVDTWLILISKQAECILTSVIMALSCWVKSWSRLKLHCQITDTIFCWASEGTTALHVTTTLNDERVWCDSAMYIHPTWHLRHLPQVFSSALVWFKAWVNLFHMRNQTLLNLRFNSWVDFNWTLINFDLWKIQLRDQVNGTQNCCQLTCPSRSARKSIGNFIADAHSFWKSCEAKTCALDRWVEETELRRS